MTPAPNYTYAAELLRVVDGDTIEVRIDLGFSVWHVCTLRIDGINCPERRELVAWRAATVATQDYCRVAEGRLVVQTRPDPKRRQDSFRRYLAKVWAEGREQELGEYLLATHHAVPFSG